MVVTRRRASLAASTAVEDQQKAPQAAGAPRRQPVWEGQTLDLTIGDLRRAILAESPWVFERSLLKSGAYLAADLLGIALLYWASTLIDPSPLPRAAKAAAWCLYWFFQGAVATGVWVVAHECGHQAFSKWQAVNDGVGLVFHSLLLVPYYSWKTSHRRHHSNCGSLDRDEVFVPSLREAASEALEPEQWWPVRLFRLATSLLLGWPLYLLFNVASRPYPEKLWVNHFDPWSPIFSKRERIEVAVTDAALVGVLYGLGWLAKTMGWAWLVKVYVVPYLIVNFWLVTTLLQHTHPDLPHYRGEEWDWLRGALATVDRSYGRLLNTLHHHIQDTHVAHHLFSTVPHYNAHEATRIVKPLLGPLYRSDDRPLLSALWADWCSCRYVAPDQPGGKVLWFRD